MTKVIVENKSGASFVLNAEQHPRLCEAIQLAIAEIIGAVQLDQNGNERKRGRPPKQLQPSSDPPHTPVATDNATMT
jgi:hypothetical protein